MCQTAEFSAHKCDQHLKILREEKKGKQVSAYYFKCSVQLWNKPAFHSKWKLIICRIFVPD